MSKKIATPAVVFAACDRLEAAGESWNRDDVRIAVGGGGFNVIDPLIKTWRKLQPLRALAPSTPAELLSQIAESLERHYGGFLADVQRREQDRMALFEATATELAGRIEAQDQQLSALHAQQEQLQQERDRLISQVQQHQAWLHERNRDLSVLQAENDELRGQLQRLEQMRQQDLYQHKEALKELSARQDEKQAELLRQHNAELEKQRKHLLEASELAENRWVRQLDRQRIDSESQQKTLSAQLQDARNAERNAQGQVTQLKTQLQRHQDQLESLRTEHGKVQRQLESREQESSSLHDLKASILALQRQLGAGSN